MNDTIAPPASNDLSPSVFRRELGTLSKRLEVLSPADQRRMLDTLETILRVPRSAT